MEAAFFDLDKTVIAKASVAAFGRTLYDQGLISWRVLLRVAAGHLIYLQLGADRARLDKMRRSLLTITRGWERSRMEKIVSEALTDVIEPIIYKEALELIEEHQSAGRKVVIVSSSPQEIVRPLAEFLGADDSIGSRACVDTTGRYTGELEFYSYGDAKAEAIELMAKEKDIDLQASYAYSDSHTDIPMLDAVGHPVAVNPDKELLRIARAHKWPIVQFSHPMTLGMERVNRRMRFANAMLLSTAIGAAGLAYGYWQLRQKTRVLRGELERRRS